MERQFHCVSASAEIRVCTVVIGDDKPSVKRGTADGVLVANRFNMLSH